MGSIYGVRYASGPYVVREAVPSSAFSAGDVLCFTSASSLSRMPATWGAQIAGVALSASTASYRNLVSYLIAGPDTVFWSDATIGSQYTPGEELDFEYTGGRFFLTTSATTRAAVVDRGSTDISQSVRSQVQIRFVQNSTLTTQSGTEF